MSNDKDNALSILRGGPHPGRSGCIFAKATEQCPEDVQAAIRQTEYDFSIAAGRFRELFKAYDVRNVPGETSIRRHRNGGCDCLRSTDD